jgi:hypothetical protein
MRVFLLLCLFSFFLKSLSAQNPVDSFHVGWSGSKIQMRTVRDQSGDWHATILLGTDSMKILILNRDFKIVRVFTMPRKDENLVSGFILNGKIFLFCNQENPHGSHNYTVDLTTGNVNQLLIVAERRKEKMICRMSSGDCALWLGIDQENSNFVIYNWRGQHEMDTIVYHFTEPGLWHDISKSAGFNREVDVSKIDEAGLPDIAPVGAENKVYLVNDTLFLTMNRNIGNTLIYTFDLKNKITSVRSIENEHVKTRMDLYTKLPKADENYVDNSFLLNGKLYFASATNDYLHVIIFDLYNGNILQKFEVKREDTIAFKNTVVTQEGVVLYFTNTKELTKTKQLLRKMTSGNAAIAAIRDSAGIAITVGSNKEMYTMDGGAPGSMTYMSTVPVTVPTGGMGNFSQGTWTKAVRFRMLIDSTNFHHIPGNMELSINDRLDDFTKDIKIPDDAKNLLFQDSRYIYIYYDKSKRSLILRQFPI